MSRSASEPGQPRGANTTPSPAVEPCSVERPPAQLVDALGPQLLPRQRGRGSKAAACARGRRDRAGRPSGRRGTGRCAAGSRCAGRCRRRRGRAPRRARDAASPSSSSPGSWPPPGVAHTVTSGNSKRTSSTRVAGSSTRARTDERMRSPVGRVQLGRSGRRCVQRGAQIDSSRRVGQLAVEGAGTSRRSTCTPRTAGAAWGRATAPRRGRTAPRAGCRRCGPRSTLAVADSPGSTLTMWAWAGSPGSTCSSRSGSTSAGRVRIGARAGSATSQSSLQSHVSRLRAGADREHLYTAPRARHRRRRPRGASLRGASPWPCRAARRRRR